MSAPLLTIIVPTYNRADHLSRLLQGLMEEVQDVSDDVVVLVSDNASTDHTASVNNLFRAKWPGLMVQRHETNLGPDGNFCSCVNRVSSRYFWIIGDDDCPKRGVVKRVVNLVRDHAPALLYMQSEWLNPVLGPDQGEPVAAFSAEWCDATEFACKVHAWLTFISGVVIDKERLRVSLGNHTIDRFTATNLVQLGWVLPLLSTTGPFAFVPETCILATKDNSGGYGLLTVFGVNFARIINESFGASSPLARRIIRENVVNYLPGLIWMSRFSTGRTHSVESPWPAMQKHIGHHPLFWLLLVPLGRFPQWLAHPFYLSWRIYQRLHRTWRRSNERTSTRRVTA